MKKTSTKSKKITPSKKMSADTSTKTPRKRNWIWGIVVLLFVLGAIAILFKPSMQEPLKAYAQKSTQSYTPGQFGDTLYGCDNGNCSGSNSFFSSYDTAPSNAIYPTSVDNSQYEKKEENSVKQVSKDPISTFSIDVDTASYANVRAYLQNGDLPPVDAVRIEEMVNYFPYDYAIPTTPDKPFAIQTTLTESPWKKGNKLLHIGIKGYEKIEKKPLNLVLLIDTSGSMEDENKLELLKKGFNLLVDQLTDKDTLSIVTYAGDSRVVLEPTPGNKKTTLRNAINTLGAEGSTWGAGGLKQAYELAHDNYDINAINRILIGTDGDFNVGDVDGKSLEDFIKRQKDKGIYLSVLSVGRNNYNDATMQKIAQAGNGIGYYLDSYMEAKKVLVNDITQNMFPIANDVKIQVEFNPNKVAEYRLVGYETRLLNREDFNNDTVDAGDIGAGHSVTAVYELTPVGSVNILVDDLRYGVKPDAAKADATDETAFVRVRYKLPDEKTSLLIEQPVVQETKLDSTSDDVRFSIAVAGFAQNLKNSKFKGDWSIDDMKKMAKSARGDDNYGYRNEFIGLIDISKSAKKHD